jgi:adenylyltransferase/sulfurtransferase
LRLENPKLVLDRDFLVQLNCRTCDSHKKIEQPLCLVGSSEGVCESCQQPLQPETIFEITFDSDYADQPLTKLGIPDWDIVKIQSNHETTYVQLKPV